jgi:Flp pilus assembly protein TadD
MMQVTVDHAIKIAIQHHHAGRLVEAEQIYRQILAQRPHHPDALNFLGVLASQVGRHDDGIALIRRAISLQPDYASAYSNLGNALRDQGKVDEAIVALRQCISLDPNFAEAHWNLAVALLLRGDFAQGWAEQEWRLKWKGVLALDRELIEPMWHGEELNGRTILLHVEQGLGDTIQHIRFAPDIVARGGKVMLYCQPELARLLQTMPALEQVIPVGRPLSAFDLHCPLLSVPMVLGITLKSIPNSVPYLSADPRLIEDWSNLLMPADQALKVGLAWAGSAVHTSDKRRSLELKRLTSLSAVEGAKFYSLQKGPAASQAIAGDAGLNVIDFSAKLTDFAETAALIANLDLVITVDTAVAHLAGAMGKPVWVLLPFAPDWRWMLDREDSPWYPTMRLFRQTSMGQWDEVIARLAESLENFVARASSP